MSLENFKKSLTKKIIHEAMRETINKPRIRGLKVSNAVFLCDNSWSYKNVTCEVIDEFIHPITKKHCIEIYTAVYDGSLVMLSQGIKEK